MADIIVKFQTQQDKSAVMAAARGKTPISFEESQLLLFSDIKRGTLNWRKSLQPSLLLLRSNNIQYSWGTPRLMTFTSQGTLYRARSRQELATHLRQLGLTSPHPEPTTSLPRLDPTTAREFIPRSFQHAKPAGNIT
ncbi:Hypothetical predicted protein [Pelobates cultripes]|uniref:Uncharacterized protein n=1 Tax=Pelobates cultripes TaxID=61616 RepID=A0AAD1VRQ2_PELCU|nr:Hypothetical predicted protein [Pelobates cultripes]